MPSPDERQQISVIDGDAIPAPIDEPRDHDQPTVPSMPRLRPGEVPVMHDPGFYNGDPTLRFAGVQPNPPGHPLPYGRVERPRRAAIPPPSPMHIAGGVGSANLERATILRRAEAARVAVPADPAALELVDAIMRAVAESLPAPVPAQAVALRMRVIDAVQVHEGRRELAAATARVKATTGVLDALRANGLDADLTAIVMGIVGVALEASET